MWIRLAAWLDSEAFEKRDYGRLREVLINTRLVDRVEERVVSAGGISLSNVAVYTSRAVLYVPITITEIMEALSESLEGVVDLTGVLKE